MARASSGLPLRFVVTGVIHLSSKLSPDGLRSSANPQLNSSWSRKIFFMPTPPDAAALAVLKKVSIFSGLSEQEFSFLASHVLPRKYSSGELIFNEGDVCAGLYVVQSGNVRIFKSSAGGREQVLAIDGPGSSIAELPVFDGGNYPASAQAVSDSTLLFFSRQDFQVLCIQHPDVALKVLRVVGARLRRLVGIIEELSFSTVRHRLIALLVRLGKTEGTRNGEGISLTLPSNNSELAAQIGTVRELVSRNLSRLQAEGLIQVDNRKLEIPSLKRLETELEASGG
jgi:CRP/FNR family cyclic AMP-dependent transcriptional regulator